MFYCNECARKNKWPETFFKSVGICESCGNEAVCHETKSSILSVAQIPEAKMLQATMNLRWLETEIHITEDTPQLVRVLQQCWINTHTGEHVWQTIPIEKA